MKDFFWKFGSLFITIATTLIILGFYFGVARGEIEDKADRSEVKNWITETIDAYAEREKDQYVKIDQVPGLIETLNSINEKFAIFDKRLERIEDKVVYGEK